MKKPGHIANQHNNQLQLGSLTHVFKTRTGLKFLLVRFFHYCLSRTQYREDRFHIHHILLLKTTITWNNSYFKSLKSHVTNKRYASINSKLQHRLPSARAMFKCPTQEPDLGKISDFGSVPEQCCWRLALQFLAKKSAILWTTIGIWARSLRDSFCCFLYF